MNNDIRLFINGEEIEFSQDPKILLNFKQDELRNPTVVKNSFTKQIQVEGTNRNNDIFGHIWELTRVQDGNFNPIKKTDFQLFVNGELSQKGYCKLDKITRTNNTTQYSLTLYGGLGSFFYNLTYDQDNEGNNKKTLASLKYTIEGDKGPGPDLDFTITKDSVYEAWGQLAGFGDTTNPRWDVINFIPALNGIPGDFDAAKVLVNNYQLNSGGASGFLTGKTVDGRTYSPVLNAALNQYGYSLGEMPEDLQEWQTRDLRCYNQRPVVSMYRIIQACCDPQNNGGYQVKLDSHFFHNNNPYYFNSWVTMPLLKDLEGMGGGERYDITGATISTGTTQAYGRYMFPVNFETETLGSINNVDMDIAIAFEPEDTTDAQYLYPHHNYYSKGTTLQGNYYVKELECNQGAIIQLFALGTGGEVVGQSKAYLLSGQKNWNERDNEPMWEYFYGSKVNEYGVEPNYEYLEGYFKLVDGKYVWCDKYGNLQNINVSFNAPSDFSALMMKITKPYSYRTKYLFSGKATFKTENYSGTSMYVSRDYSTTGRHTVSEAMAQDRVRGKFSFSISRFEGVGTDYESLFSGTKITKERLLTTENSPCDYLLSYCKMFGLYFYYDSTEEADNPRMYPSGVVHIMDRDTFYTDEVVDLSKMIDWDKKLEITPSVADTKWYKFDTEHIESELETAYKEQFGQDYGAQIVNTSYNFNSDTTALYDGNVFKSGIMALERDKYYRKTSAGLPVYQYNGLKYNLYSRTSSTEEFSTTEIEYPVSTIMNMPGVNPDYEYYDSFPKLQLHGENNEATDGENILVFLRGSVNTNADYWISDDIPEMATLNDGQPCWILTNSENDAAGRGIAKRINMFPFFTRDLVWTGTYGNIVHSWNFGHPQITYSPDTYTTEGDSIYDACWKNYIRDMYSVNARKLSCYVKAQLDGRPWPYWLRRFYWFENSIWRLNEIKDLNLGAYDTTKMEFIKVQDMDNYKLEKIEYQGFNQIVLDQNTLACTGGTITGKIILQGGGNWVASDIIGGEDAEGNQYYLESATAMVPNSGSGNITEFTLTVPASTADTPINWSVAFEDDLDVWHKAYFTQETCNTASTLTLTPATTTVSAPASSATLTVTAIRITGITVTSNAAWATVTRDGNVITISYTKNNTTTARTATITVKGTGVEGEMTATATLQQNGLGQVSVSPTTLEFDWVVDGVSGVASKTINVTTNDDWSSTINDNA